MNDPRFPIGPWKFDGNPTPEGRREWIAAIATAPEGLRAAVRGLSEEQLDTPYREGGWTVRQVVHHLPDSHLNAYVRFRLALTEDHPTIRPYDEASWARLPDAQSAPVELSLGLLESLHRRWVALLQALGPMDFARVFLHPEHGRAFTLDEVLAMYAWHGRHHTAHVLELRRRRGWG